MADFDRTPLAELAREAERAVSPDFEQVVGRARSRRRRQRTATALVALAAVGAGAAVATALPHRTDTSPPVTHRSSPPPKHLSAEDRIRRALEDGSTRIVAAADPDHVLVVRRYCPRRAQRCWWGSEVSGAPASRRPAAQVGPVPVAAGTSGFWIEPPGRLLGLDGSVHVPPAGTQGDATPSRPTRDAVLGMVGDGGFSVYEPSRDRQWSVQLPGVTSPPIRALVLTDDGRIWMQQDDGTRALVSSSGDGGRSWTRHDLPRLASGRYGKVLWHAGTVGVPVYDDHGRLQEIRVLRESRWTDVPAGRFLGLRLAGGGPVAEPDIAGLSDGSLYVRDPADRLFQAAPDSWTSWSQVAETPTGLALVGSGDVLLGIGDDQHTVYRWARPEWQVVD